MGLGGSRWTPIVTLAMALAHSAPTQAQEGNQNQAKQFEEVFLPLKGKPDDTSKLPLIGDLPEVVKLEPQGLRITLPKNFAKLQQNHGVNTRQLIHGDFEITASFEVLKEPSLGEAGPEGTKIHLLLLVNRPPFDVIGFSRHMPNQGPSFFSTWHNAWDKKTKKNNQQFADFPAKSTKWRFRLTRTGALYSYYLSEDGDADFRLLQTFLFIDEDLKGVRLVAATGGPNAELDMRISDLRIRAESLPDKAALRDLQEVPDAPGATPQKGFSWFWLTVGMGILMVLAMVLALLRNRRVARIAHDRKRRPDA